MKKVLIGLVLSIIAGLAVYFITQYLSEEKLTIEVDSQAIHVTNNMEQTLVVRVRFASKVEGGTQYSGHTDNKIFAKQTVSYPLPSFTFDWYEIRVWDTDNNFLFEKVGEK